MATAAAAQPVGYRHASYQKASSCSGGRNSSRVERLVTWSRHGAPTCRRARDSGGRNSMSRCPASVCTLTLQRHFSAMAKFAHVESRFCGHRRRGKAAFDVPVNPCVRSVCSRSVVVGLKHQKRNVLAYLTAAHEAALHGAAAPSLLPACEMQSQAAA